MAIRSFSFDAKKPEPGKKFKANRAAETAFQRALKKVARVSAHIVEHHTDGAKIEYPAEMLKALTEYSKLIGPWAERQSAKMLAQVSKSNKRAYTSQSNKMAMELKLGVAQQDVGQAARALMNEQVALIKSIPLEAGLRAQKLAEEAFYNGSRASEIANELMRTNEVTLSRATLIARTETARSNAAINESRATAVGSNRYIWRNSNDEAVRESHRRYHGKRMDGQVFSWDSPPTLDDGTTGHPGTFPNCRCYAEALFEDD